MPVRLPTPDRCATPESGICSNAENETDGTSSRENEGFFVNIGGGFSNFKCESKELNSSVGSSYMGESGETDPLAIEDVKSAESFTFGDEDEDVCCDSDVTVVFDDDEEEDVVLPVFSDSNSPKEIISTFTESQIEKEDDRRIAAENQPSMSEAADQVATSTASESCKPPELRDTPKNDANSVKNKRHPTAIKKCTNNKNQKELKGVAEGSTIMIPYEIVGAPFDATSRLMPVPALLSIPESKEIEPAEQELLVSGRLEFCTLSGASNTEYSILISCLFL